MMGRFKPRTRHGILPGMSSYDGQPVVSTVGNAARMLGVDVDQLAAAVLHARLQPWGSHASGLAVYRWRLLRDLAANLPSSKARSRR
jgi:hypothetical protein